MGHIDHAHQTEGNPQAEGGQQQDAAQAEAVEQVAEAVNQKLATLKTGQDRLRGLADRRVGLDKRAVLVGLQQGFELGSEPQIPGLANHRNRGQTLGLVLALEL